MIVLAPRFLLHGFTESEGTWIHLPTWWVLLLKGVGCSVLSPVLCSLRAEIWSVILLLQAAATVHVGIDNLNVVRHGDRLVQVAAPCLSL